MVSYGTKVTHDIVTACLFIADKNVHMLQLIGYLLSPFKNKILEVLQKKRQVLAFFSLLAAVPLLDLLAAVASNTGTTPGTRLRNLSPRHLMHRPDTQADDAEGDRGIRDRRFAIGIVTGSGVTVRGRHRRGAEAFWCAAYGARDMVKSGHLVSEQWLRKF